MHVNEKYQDPSCEINTCKLRHPRVCNFYRDYGRCKFGEWCSFEHKEVDRTDKSMTMIEEIKKEVEDLKKTIEEKNDIINSLSEKIQAIETKVFSESEEIPINKPEEIETAIEVALSAETLEDIHEFNCDLCYFVGKSGKGLIIHKGRKHGKKITCDVCENSFESNRDFKIHQLSHSFKSKFKTTRFENQVCKKCNYSCKTIESMEVHLGKGCLEFMECGLCESRFETFEILQTHLNTCEVYECGRCRNRFKTLSEVKRHAEEEHEDCQK